ncbi:unnamed protein product [Brassicogethes aeneus]|uniref:Uncharacterized protein n=1 Tax=Brassicogethes aeneus TaxID=1431903 RepID=A0A9P0FLU8_BRAAE|nr:unnamed protein product [Brassicogethes aeneus]
MDVGSILSILGVLFFNFSFVAYIKEYAKIIENLSDFKPYGKPGNFDEETKKLNLYSKIHGLYIFVCIVIFAGSSTIKFGWCSTKSSYECGIFIQPYMPFDIDHYPGLMVYLSISKFTFDIIGIFMGYFSSMALVSVGGQRIQEKSVSVSTAVYNTSWYSLDVKIQRMLILVMVRSRKPLNVRAGPFGIMNYPLILGVLKTSYSCLTCLLTTNEA